jgi:hypothetical protein
MVSFNENRENPVNLKKGGVIGKWKKYMKLTITSERYAKNSYLHRPY